MSKEKITGNMSMEQIIFLMSEGNIGAMNVVFQMLGDPEISIMGILQCDHLGIRGSKLYMLHNDCCDRDNDIFKKTLGLLASGVFTEEEIDANLSLTRAIPFVDESIVVEGLADDVRFGIKWDEYCERTRESFIKRLNEKLGHKRFTLKKF